MRKIKPHYWLEAFALRGFFTLLRLLPLDIASALGGVLGCAIGPFFSAHKTARKNLKEAFPDLSDREISTLVDKMWEHLGRVGAEYPFLDGERLTRRVEVAGVEHFPEPGKPVLFFSGHIGNWELLSPVAFSHGVDISIVYRHTNNPVVDAMIAGLRQHHCSELISKGLRGGIKILSVLKRGGSVALLADQKQNNGISVPFFGREAMTSPAIAEIALKYDIPIVPARMIRTRGANFRCLIYPPLTIQRTGNHKDDVLAAMGQINQMLEDWIRAHPEQWFWVHRRWPKTA